jgi:hypothetical protein
MCGTVQGSGRERMQGASLCTSTSPWIGQDLVRKLALLTLPAAQLITLLPKLAGLLVPTTATTTTLLPASATRVVREPARQRKKEGESAKIKIRAGQKMTRWRCTNLLRRIEGRNGRILTCTLRHTGRTRACRSNSCKAALLPFPSPTWPTRCYSGVKNLSRLILLSLFPPVFSPPRKGLHDVWIGAGRLVPPPSPNFWSRF